MERNAIKSDFGTSKMAAGGHFKKNIYKKSCASDFNNVRTDCWPTTIFYINSLLVNIYTDRYVGNEGIYIVFAL